MAIPATREQHKQYPTPTVRQPGGVKITVV